MSEEPREQASILLTIDGLRDRFGAGAVTRAVLIGRDQGVAAPMLAD